ncbi:hypothetical protein ACFL2A_05150 [Thermodesulfobacteriota bacterium]
MSYENMNVNITRPNADNYYALLFVGVCNRQRYVESLIRWTNLLHEMYGYPLANIRIIVGTYSNLAWAPMVAGTDITYDATMADLDDALADYATGSGSPYELGADDNLFIFTFNHGGQDPAGSYLCAENFGQKYFASDFGARINALHCRQVVLLAAQCRSGGFVDPFINNLWGNTRGAVIAGSRSDQDTMEAVFDKLCASAFNGRMVQDALDDNIDLGITGEGMDVTLVPGYSTNRIDWGPTGAISTREVFNWVNDHYINNVYASYASIIEIPLYDQKPWIEAGRPVHIRLGEPDLIMQDCDLDVGDEPSTCASPWHSPDIYPDNTDQFPATTSGEYVPAHNNRFFARTANRGTAPTDNVWRILEVRGLGFTGGPVGPPRIDRATEPSGTTKISARLRPGRAHTQSERIMIGDDFGHGCVSAASWCGTDEISHNLWSIRQDNDQAQHNLNPAAVSGAVPVDTGSVNSNAGKIIRKIQIDADRRGNFELLIGKIDKNLPVRVELKKKALQLRKGEKGEFILEIALAEKIKDGVKAQLAVTLLCDKEIIGGFTLLLRTATANARVFVHDCYGRPIPSTKVILSHPGDPRKLIAKTDKKGIAVFGPLNPGFYFASANDCGCGCGPVRAYISPKTKNFIKLCADRDEKPGKKLSQKRKGVKAR